MTENNDNIPARAYEIEIVELEKELALLKRTNLRPMYEIISKAESAERFLAQMKWGTTREEARQLSSSNMTLVSAKRFIRHRDNQVWAGNENLYETEKNIISDMITKRIEQLSYRPPDHIDRNLSPYHQVIYHYWEKGYRYLVSSWSKAEGEIEVKIMLFYRSEPPKEQIAHDLGRNDAPDPYEYTLKELKDPKMPELSEKRLDKIAWRKANKMRPVKTGE